MISLLFIAGLSAGSIWAATTIDPANKNAYGANIGWINAEADTVHGAVIGQAFCSGYLYSANCGWIHLGDGNPANHRAYANNSASDYGINHDGLGNLTGSAYGANIGWITFEQTYGQSKINLSTGELSGYAWSANTGWINLNGLTTLCMDSGLDNDQDGIPDCWEYTQTHSLSVLAGSPADQDQDGVSDADEYLADTNPLDARDYLRITEFEQDGSTHELSWTCVPTRSYTLQHCTALTNNTSWINAGSASIPATSHLQMTQEVTGVNDRARFYRVQSVPPLQQ